MEANCHGNANVSAPDYNEHTSSAPIILLVDDNRLPTQDYADEMKMRGLNPKHLPGPDETFEFLDSLSDGTGQPKAIVLDIMMPPGERYRHVDTTDGLRTGVVLFGDLRARFPEMPVIVLTNVKKEDDLKQKIGSEGPLLRFVQKDKILPDELLDLVIEMTQG